MDASLPEIVASGQLYTVIDSLHATKYLAVACFALLVYDYILTLEQEASNSTFAQSVFYNLRSCSIGKTLLESEIHYNESSILPGKHPFDIVRTMRVCSLSLESLFTSNKLSVGP